MRLRLRAAAMICLTVGLVAATPQLLPTGAPRAPRVAVDQSYPVPASGRYTVRGHGYGHGRGMSQHGAQGAALEGLSHQRILQYYYPGTELTTTSDRIRVLVSADTSSDLVVEARKGLRLKDLGSGTVHTLPQVGATRWRVAVSGSNRNVVSYLSDGRWRPWSPGGADALVGAGEFRARGPVTLVTPGGQRTYRGWLRAVPPSAGSSDRDTVNVLPLDSYVMGVVPYEMPALWEPEAVQSQAVAARSYAVWHRSRNQDRYYQVCDTTACQVYGGVDGEHPRSNAAVTQTARQVLTYGGKPAFTEFSASSGGWTTKGDFAYLPAQQDPYDDWSGNSNHDWSLKLSAATIQKRFPKLGKLQRIRVTERTGHGQWQGRVLNLVLVGSKGNVPLSGDEFRWAFGLKSTWFSF